GKSGHGQQAGVEFLDQDAQVHLAPPDQTSVEEGVIGPGRGRLAFPAPVRGLKRRQRVVVQILQRRIVGTESGNDVDQQDDGVLRLEVDVVEDPVAMPAGWLPVEEDLGPAFDAVEPDVAEVDALLVLLHRALLSEELELMTGQRAGVGADVEDVTEVRLDQERALDVDRIPAAILDADPLVQAAVDEAAAP